MRFGWCVIFGALEAVPAGSCAGWKLCRRCCFAAGGALLPCCLGRCFGPSVFALCRRRDVVAVLRTGCGGCCSAALRYCRRDLLPPVLEELPPGWKVARLRCRCCFAAGGVSCLQCSAAVRRSPGSVAGCPEELPPA